VPGALAASPLELQGRSGLLARHTIPSQLIRCDLLTGIPSFSFRFNISSFHIIRNDVTSSGVRGVCALVRNNFLFSVFDTSNLTHSSLEMQGFLLHCSLDALILIINVYRHPNHNTLFSVYSTLLSRISAFKYVFVVGDFNAHHHAWGDPRIDKQGEQIVRVLDDHHALYCFE